MSNFANKLRFILATCLTLFAVGVAKAAPPDSSCGQECARECVERDC